MEAPNIKVFISYSWTNAELVEWVRDELASKLLSDGIEVILDQWDLKEGHDTFKFMEGMVTDTSVQNVLVLCDKGYQEKANERRGGVGTETQIITPNVYSEVNQQKFIPIIVERDENGNDFVPAFMNGRKYIDFSTDENFFENYEQLLRTLYKRPQYRKPAKGKAPRFLFEEEEINDYKFHFLLNQIKSDIQKGRINIVASKIEEFKREFIDSLDDFKVLKKESAEATAKVIEEKIDNMLILRDDFVELLEELINSDLITVDFLIDFFESLYNKNIQIRSEANGFFDFQFDHFKFLIRELFLYTNTLLIKNDRFQIANELLNARYFLYKDFIQNGKEGNGFEKFQCHLISLEEIQGKKNDKIYLSYMAEKIVMRSTLKNYSKADLANTDIILYYLSALRKKTTDRHWFPQLYVYALYSKIELLQKLESMRHFEKVKPLFEVNSVDELKKLFSDFKNPYTQGFQNSFESIPDISSNIEIENIGEYR